MRILINIFSIFICINFYFTAHAHILKNTPQHKWRVIYVEGGQYKEYQLALLSLIKELMQQDIIVNTPIPDSDSFENTSELWNWIIKNTKSEFLEFVPDGFYSANWDSEQRKKQKKTILTRIHEKNDIDIILAFGNFAGIDFATNEHDVSTFVMAVTDSIEAKIIKSVNDSGFDHVHASIETGRYERQLTTFHDVFKFKTLGIPYNQKENKVTIAYKQIENAANKLGFQLNLCSFDGSGTKKQILTNFIACIKKLAKECDAIYLTINVGMQAENMTKILQPIIEANIPTFSQLGARETELGVLMSLSRPSFESEGKNTANAIKNTINGLLPRDCTQEFSGPLGLAINLKMAVLIGWNPSFEILAAVDNIYHDIKNGK